MAPFGLKTGNDRLGKKTTGRAQAFGRLALGAQSEQNVGSLEQRRESCAAGGAEAAGRDVFLIWGLEAGLD